MEEADHFTEVWEQSFDSCILPVTGAREELPHISVHITRKGHPTPPKSDFHRERTGEGRRAEERGRVRGWKGGLVGRVGLRGEEKAWKSALEGKQDREMLVRSKRTYIKRPKALSSFRSPRERELCLATIHSHRLTPVAPNTPDFSPTTPPFSPEFRPFPGLRRKHCLPLLARY